MLRLDKLGKQKKGFKLQVHWGTTMGHKHLEDTPENRNTLEQFLKLVSKCINNEQTKQLVKELQDCLYSITETKFVIPTHYTPELIYALQYSDGDYEYSVSLREDKQTFCTHANYMPVKPKQKYYTDKDGNMLNDGDIVVIKGQTLTHEGIIQQQQIYIPEQYVDYTTIVSGYYLPQTLAEIDSKYITRKEKLSGPVWKWVNEYEQKRCEE